MPMPESSDPIRAFVAACLGADLLEKIRAEQGQLERRLGSADIRWTGAAQLHLTLRFFGNVASNDLDALKLALPRAVEGVGPLRLTVQGLGCFPSHQRPSVIWFGLEGDLEPLGRLQAQIECECGRYGNHSEDRAFHPHLTVGRVKARGPEARRISEGLRDVVVGKLGDWVVDGITLMQSQLRPGGSIYTPLLEVPLRG
jgi:RNA 2',3'-cyclic 3'-phosphodiesterase